MTFDLTTSTTVKLPVVTARNFVAFPSTDFRFEFTKSLDIKALKAAEQFQNYVVIVYPLVSGVVSDEINGYYKRATIAKIVLNTAPSLNINRVKFDIIARCDIKDFDLTAPCLMATVDTVPSITTDNDTVLATLSLIKKEIVQSQSSTPEEQVINQKINLVC